MVVGIGMAVLRARVKHARARRQEHDHGHDHHHHDHEHWHDHGASGRSLLAVGVSGGLLSCPSALVAGLVMTARALPGVH